MSGYYNRNRTARPKLVTADDIGTHVTLAVRAATGKGTLYVSGVVRDVSTSHVTLGVMHHPTGPWDRWESYEAATPIPHNRIARRS